MKPSTDTATAVPTKQFFVSMLTRDIKLEDAILDLIDNCLDGALRLGNGGKPDYSKYLVKITLAKDHFSIEDNCGGIPREVAKNYAFLKFDSSASTLEPSGVSSLLMSNHSGLNWMKPPLPFWPSAMAYFAVSAATASAVATSG